MLDYDSSLNPVLSRANTHELAPLHDLVMSKPFSEMLSITESYLRHKSDHAQYANEIASEIRRFGGNTFANLARGGRGPSYHEIVCDVATALKVPFNKARPVEDIEEAILTTVCEKAFESMTPEERLELLGKIGKPNLSFLKGGSVMALQAILRAGGFRSYQLMLIVANAVVTTAIGRGLPVVINWLAVKGLSIAIGPIGWAASVLTTLNQLAGPSHRVIIPSVIHVAGLRLQHKLRPCPNCSALVPDSFSFCNECGTRVDQQS
ncbi:MAG: hypothetical protein OXI90_02300 [Gammaproteobacteria bacterium]|nr:hypothetical protein [Gammaproteobacteria bacterium]